MTTFFKKLLLPLILLPLSLNAQESRKLSGEIIGTVNSVDYSTGNSSTTVNTKANAFDGKLDTYFASYDRSFTWVGLNLGSKHVITRVGWAARNDSHGEERVQLSVFEGANMPDFSDAVPLYLNPILGKIGEYQYADINVSKGFQYVRYVGPNDSRCNIAEVEFYGYAGDGDNSFFYRPTNLPLISVHIENNAEPQDKVTDLVCSVTLIPADATDTLKIKPATIRLRGNASMSFPKKPYRIKFENKHHVFNSPASAKKWTLINSYGDKTLMRNILAFELSKRLEMEYTPFNKAVDLIVNGEYKGCYLLCDQIEVDKDRVNIEKMDSTCISGDLLTGGYLVEVDAYANSEPNYFYSNRGNPVNIKYPDSDEVLPQQTDYIKNQFNMMESSLFSSGFSTATGYRQLLDLDSFLKNFLVGEVSGNTDTYWSTNMYKHRGDAHFYVGPVWDFDLAFENDNRTYPICQKSDFVYTFGSCAGHMKDFVNRIVKNDPGAAATLSNMWADARRNKGLSAESFIELVDKTAKELNESQKLNFIRWPILSEYVHQNWQASGSYEGEVEIVKNYIAQRFPWMDAKLGFDATGINDINNNISTDTEDIFTIDGIKVSTNEKKLPKGVYVRSGRKFIVK